MSNVIIAGAGASGLCAAIMCARNGCKVTIIEKTDVVGKKLSITGNGRCNLTNLDMKPEDFNDAAAGRMKGFLERFDAEAAIRFFRTLGVIVQSEEGYIYPASNQASTVVNALYSECLRLGVQFMMHQQLKEVIVNGDSSFTIRTDKDRFDCDKFIMATGSLSGPKVTASTGDGYYICKKLGMSIKDCYPALVGMKADSDYLPLEGGVRAQARVDFLIGKEVIISEFGEVQFTKDSISGFPIMQASGRVSKFLADGTPISCEIDFFPEYDDESFEVLKDEMCKLRDNRTLEEFLSGVGNSNINDMIIRRMKFSKSMHMKNIAENMTRNILDTYRHYRIELTGPTSYQQAQVTTGGVSLGEVDDNLMARKVPGMYIIGELLDIDGRCGGYNLQWAWTSAFIAAQSASLS